jgi:hypothetical protein
MRPRRAERLAVVVVCCASLSFAGEVARDDHGGVLEASAFYKSLLSGLVLQPDAVSGARVLGALTGTPSVPDGGFLSAHLARVSTRFRFDDKVKLDVAWQLALSLASDPAFSGGSALSGTVGGTGAGAQRRVVELGGPLGSGSTWRADHNLDRLALQIALPFGDLTVGRQVLSWGTGRFWNPTDVLSPFPPTVIDREVRRGFDAVRLAVALGDVTQLDLLYLPQLVPEDAGGVVRFQTNVKGWDGSVSVGKYVRDVVIGADVVGDLGPVGVHAEGAYALELRGLGTSSVSVGEHFFRGVIGAEVKPHEKVVLLAEYSFNGFGTTDPRQYARILSSARVLRGEVFGAGQHQAALAASYFADDLLSVSLAALGNLTDPSAMLIPSLEWSITQHVLLRAGAYLPLGRGPDTHVYDGLTENDVRTQSARFREATAARGLRSEYGSSSYGAFVQLGLYAP